MSDGFSPYKEICHCGHDKATHFLETSCILEPFVDGKTIETFEAKDWMFQREGKTP